MLATVKLSRNWRLEGRLAGVIDGSSPLRVLPLLYTIFHDISASPLNRVLLLPYAV